MKEYENVPSYDLDIEQIILSGLMLEPISIIENHIKPEWFYLDHHQLIIEALLQLKASGTPVDIFQVKTQLAKNGKLDQIGGLPALFAISERITLASNLKHHIRILCDLYTRRELGQKAMKAYQKSFDLSIDVDDLVNDWQSNALELMDYNASSVVTIESSIQEVIEQARLNQKGIQITGIPTGLLKLDKHTGGMQKGDLIIIAGETSQGKTAFAVSILRNVIEAGYKAAAYSLEMTHRQLTARLMAQTTSISSKKILTGILSSQEINSIQSLSKDRLTGLYYDESSSNSIDNICASIRRLKLKFDIQVVVVDFIQIVTGNDKKSDESKLADIARKLKNVAKEQNLVIIALSQLSRDNNRPFPTIARLRGSGQIEEAADIILLIYRPEVYGRKYDEPFENEPVEGTAQVIVGKGRNVGMGMFLLKFNPETTGFYDYRPDHDKEYH